MRWEQRSDDRAAWSAAGGVLTACGAGAAVAWLVAVEPSTASVPVWPVYPFGAVAVVGFYLMLAPLLRLSPWHPPPDSPKGRQPAGVTAGRAIRAGGDIQAHGAIVAGDDIEAGGNLQTVAGVALSPPERDRITRETAERAVRTTYDRLLRRLDKRNEPPRLSEADPVDAASDDAQQREESGAAHEPADSNVDAPTDDG
jgi:hypothetical protein